MSRQTRRDGDLDSQLAKAEAENRELEKAQRLADLEAKNRALRAQQARARFPDGAKLAAGSNLLIGDPTELTDDLKDPNRVAYWGLPDQAGQLAQRGYRKADPQPIDHAMAQMGHVLYYCDRELWEARKRAEWEAANAAEAAAERAARGVPEDVLVGADDLPLKTGEAKGYRQNENQPVR